MSILNGINVLEGYIANDLDLKSNQNGLEYTSFLLRVTDNYYDQNDQFIKRYQTIPFMVYSKRAKQMCERVVKGQKVIIQFKIVSKKDSNDYIIPALVVSNFQTLESPKAVEQRFKDTNQQSENINNSKEINNNKENPFNNTEVAEVTEIYNDDLPFQVDYSNR
ncbi:single-stranded DNA-binding protein [Macrococcus armenti]|uniref:single-stranded DNA-binding protein n=1 Tax=Macrococcus armenti TaxID=2875764 RepID=UPI001CCAEF0F|nr:single-stranded DNA-binding protein [Macrococcus armenti]UBH16620.1 single-stranded DNA-binding protein [Macrococcus armenti]UBH21254.1 single-stranded DNA-binding protein [Macrococcus armenti]